MGAALEGGNVTAARALLRNLLRSDLVAPLLVAGRSARTRARGQECLLRLHLQKLRFQVALGAASGEFDAVETGVGLGVGLGLGVSEIGAQSCAGDSRAAGARASDSAAGMHALSAARDPLQDVQSLLPTSLFDDDIPTAVPTAVTGSTTADHSMHHTCVMHASVMHAHADGRNTSSMPVRASTRSTPPPPLADMMQASASLTPLDLTAAVQHLWQSARACLVPTSPLLALILTNADNADPLTLKNGGVVGGVGGGVAPEAAALEAVVGQLSEWCAALPGGRHVQVDALLPGLRDALMGEDMLRLLSGRIGCQVRRDLLRDVCPSGWIAFFVACRSSKCCSLLRIVRYIHTS